MLLALAISTFVIILCISLHFNQHFRFRSCKEEATFSKQNNQNIFDRNSINNQTQFSQCCYNIQGCRSQLNCCCGIRVDFDFFPIAFLFYMIFILLFCILIMFRYICNNEEIFALDNGINLQYTEISQIELSNSYIDWCMYIFIFISMIWDTLFSWYRFYTTMISSKYLYSPKFYHVLKPFSIYIILFIILFIFQTQFYYWSFPILFLFYFLMNIYCVYKSGYICIQSFQQLSVVVDGDFRLDDIQTELIRNVKLMRNLSVMSILISSIYILAFLMVYNILITYYFPIIWCLSIVCFALKFARNRIYIHLKLKSLFYLFTFCHKLKYKSQNNVTITQSNPNVSKQVNIENNIVENIKISNITSHSLDYVLQHQNDSITNKNNNIYSSRSTGDLMSLLNSKRRNFSLSQIISDILHMPTQKTVESAQINKNPINKPSTTTSPTIHEDFVILTADNDTNIIINTKPAVPTPVAILTPKFTDRKLTDSHTSSLLELSLFNGSTLDTPIKNNTPVQNITPIKITKPMSTLNLPNININKYKNFVVRSASNPLLTNVESTDVNKDMFSGMNKKNSLMIPKPTLENTNNNSLPVAPPVSNLLKPKQSKKRSESTGCNGDSISNKKMKLKHIMSGKMLAFQRKSSAISVLDLFIAQGFCDKRSISDKKIEIR